MGYGKDLKRARKKNGKTKTGKKKFPSHPPK